MDYSQFDSHDTSPGFLLWQLTALWKHRIKVALSPLELTHTQYVIMTVTYYLQQSGIAASQKIISDYSHIDVMTLSKTIRLLEKKELIQRENDLKDTRAKVVVLTTKGTKIVKSALPLVESIDFDFFGVDKGYYKEVLALFSKLLAENNDMP
ncbi:MAG: MarR family winged helix-turn-helix transcriptional regulator [Sporomusa sp.]